MLDTFLRTSIFVAQLFIKAAAPHHAVIVHLDQQKVEENEETIYPALKLDDNTIIERAAQDGE